MANFDLVFVYRREAAADFRRRKLPRPKVRRGNQMATTADLRWAVDALDDATYDELPRGDDEWSVQHSREKYWIRIGGFDWNNPNSIPGDSFVINGGTSPLSLAVLIKLAERCGQLLVYPDSGAPPIVIDEEMDPEAVHAIYTEFEAEPDGWELFFQEMYGAD